MNTFKNDIHFSRRFVRPLCWIPKATAPAKLRMKASGIKLRTMVQLKKKIRGIHIGKLSPAIIMKRCLVHLLQSSDSSCWKPYTSLPKISRQKRTVMRRR